MYIAVQTVIRCICKTFLCVTFTDEYLNKLVIYFNNYR